jgi:iron complex outermembrane recepter protein
MEPRTAADSASNELNTGGLFDCDREVRRRPVSPKTFKSRPAQWLGRVLQGCVLGGLVALSAGAARADQALQVAIPPQALAGALAEFAHQTGLQVIYVARLARSRESKGARAGQDPAEALPALLEGTGLSFEFLNERTVRIFEATNSTAVAPPPGAQKSSQTSSSRAARSGTPDEEVTVVGSLDRNEVKIAEDVQNTAGSVSIVGGGHLEAQKLEQLSDYAAYLPSLNLDDGGAPSLYIVQLRGISSFSEASTVGYYIDDVPTGLTGSIGIGAAPELIPYDLERLEVRRGPQGTLGGAGSEIGEIRYVLNEPSVSGFEARVGADVSTTEYASRPGTSFQGMVNVPIVQDALAVRVSGYDIYNPGYIDNVYSGAKGVNVLRRYGGRVSTLWRPTESFSLKVSALWNRLDTPSGDLVVSAGSATAVYDGDANIYNVSKSWSGLQQDIPFPPAYQASTDLYAASIHWDPASVEITSTTAWSRDGRHETINSTQQYGSIFPILSGGTIPAGLSKFQRDTEREKFSEEFHVSSSHGTRIDWLLGGFYSEEHVRDQSGDYAFDTSYQPIAYFAPAIWYQVVPSTFNQRSAFADLTWHLTDQTELIGGIRYDHNDQAFSAIVHDKTASELPITFSDNYSEGVTTWAATAQHHFTRDVMLYGRVATGFLPGSTNGPGFPPVRADSLTNYELGLKSQFLERTWTVNVAAFHIDWKDIQIQNQDFSAFVNGAREKSQGVELAGAWSPVSALIFGYNATYTQVEFTELVPTGSHLLTGYQLAQVPKWSAAFIADYDWPVTGQWYAHAGGAFRWIGPLWALAVESRSQGGAPTYELPGYSVLDVNASMARAPVVLRVFVRNLADIRASRHGHLGIDPTGTIARTEDFMVRPRTVGLGVDYAF